MPRAMQVASKPCYKLVADMLYEARIQEQYLWVNTQSFLNQLCSIYSSYMS